MKSVSEAAKEEYLRTHLEERYGVRVVILHRLDKGVFRVNLHDGRCWVVRVFLAESSIEHVEGDASILQFLENESFPSERCADADPVSLLHGRGIFITEHIEGTSSGESEHTLSLCGEMLARLNLLPASQSAVARSAGYGGPLCQDTKSGRSKVSCS